MPHAFILVLFCGDEVRQLPYTTHVGIIRRALKIIFKCF